ncbi:MAG: DUF4442 domain-containing protein [Myxococcota bacterium]|jgi:acyl-coenzyme A thioesterase PaaI-like protein|nr:DUF4442 domain-containing protein [Myxococcota bacterium]
MSLVKDLMTGEGLVSRLLPGKQSGLALAMKAFGLFGVPMLGWIRPEVVELDDERCRLRIRFRRRTRNHVGSMYFGVLCAGADLASGLLAVRHAAKVNERIGLIFKDVHGDFRQKVMGHCFFECRDGAAIAEGVRQADRTGERVNVPTRILVWAEGGSPDQPAAVFQLTLSLKDQSTSKAPR